MTYLDRLYKQLQDAYSFNPPCPEDPLWDPAIRLIGSLMSRVDELEEQVNPKTPEGLTKLEFFVDLGGIENNEEALMAAAAYFHVTSPEQMGLTIDGTLDWDTVKNAKEVQRVCESVTNTLVRQFEQLAREAD